MFGQYPLQVNGFKDLHECLEAAMSEGEIESAENCTRSGQEVSGAGAQPSSEEAPLHHLACSLRFLFQQHLSDSSDEL